MTTNVSINTNEAKKVKTAKVVAKPIITSQTFNSTITSGACHEMRVLAKGKGLTYQWQVDNGMGWQFVKGADSASLKTKPKKVRNMPETYRCVVSSKGGSAISQLIKTNVLAGKEEKGLAQAARKVADTPLHVKKVIKKPIKVEEKSPANPDGVVDDLGDGSLEEITSQPEKVEKVVKSAPPKKAKTPPKKTPPKKSSK